MDIALQRVSLLVLLLLCVPYGSLGATTQSTTATSSDATTTSTQATTMTSVATTTAATTTTTDVATTTTPQITTTTTAPTTVDTTTTIPQTTNAMTTTSLPSFQATTSTLPITTPTPTPTATTATGSLQDTQRQVNRRYLLPLLLLPDRLRQLYLMSLLFRGTGASTSFHNLISLFPLLGEQLFSLLRVRALSQFLGGGHWGGAAAGSILDVPDRMQRILLLNALRKGSQAGENFSPLLYGAWEM